MPKVSRGLQFVGALLQFLGQPLRQAGYLLRSGRRSRELADEMAFHREMAARAGRPTSSFGNPVLLREQAREAWGWTWIDRLLQDVSYAVRTLRRSPIFTCTALLVLAVGIGVNVAAFSLFNLFALKPLPVRDPGSLVRLQRRSPSGSTNVVPYPSMIFYRDHAKTLSAVMGTTYASLNVDNEAKPASANFATANYFTELGTQPFLGRLLDPGRDDLPDAPPVAVLSYGLWQSRFGSDASIVGRTIHINKQAVTVIGVTPADLAALGGAHPDIWLPNSLIPYFIQGSTALTDMHSNGGTVQMWGRLAPGVSPKAAEEELLALTNQLRKQYPKEIWDNESIRSDPGGHNDVVQTEIYVASAMVGTLALLILVVACANLGGLLLARGVFREQEIGIRIAIGADRRRIFRQLFTESLVLALLGSIAGTFFSYVVLRVFMAKANGSPWMTAAPDWRVVAFAFGVGLFAAVVFGFAPALQITRQQQRRTITRQVLVAAQVAASCVLLILTGLLTRAIQHVLHTAPGFGYEQVIAVDLDLSSHGYSAAQGRNYIEQFQARLRALPGVVSLGLSSMPPLGHSRISTITHPINGKPARIFPFRVDTEFFHTMEIPLLRGRRLLPGEVHAIIVSDALARKQWPGQDPLGKQDGIGFDPGDVVVGVAGNAHLINMQDSDAVELYRAVQAADMADLTILVKTSSAPENLAVSVRSIAQSLDPKIFPDIRTLSSEFHDATQSAAKMTMIIALLGMIAVLLAALGILGLVAYHVSQRTKEIAIRIALGAPSRQVLASILGQFSWPVLIGLAAGIGGTAALSQILRRGLYGVSNLDPLSYTTAIALLIATFSLAAILPARRALKLDVARALHQE